MGIFSAIGKAVDERRRDAIAEEMGLFSNELNDRIAATVNELRRDNGDSPMAVLAAISVVESQLLEEHFSNSGIELQHRKWRAIFENMFVKRVKAIPHDEWQVLPSSFLEPIDHWMRNRYRELKPSLDLNMPMMQARFQLVDRVMWECLVDIDPNAPELMGITAKEVCRLAYEIKLEVLEHKL